MPYKGAAPAIAALASGEIQMLFDTSTSAIGHIRSGRLRGLAIASLSRFAIVIRAQKIKLSRGAAWKLTLS